MMPRKKQRIYPSQIRILCEGVYQRYAKVWGNRQASYEADLSSRQRDLIESIVSGVVRRVLAGDVPDLDKAIKQVYGDGDET